MLEYEEASAQNPKPSIILRNSEPANDEENNWKVTIVMSNDVSYTCSLLFVHDLLVFHLSSLLHTFAPLAVCFFASLRATV